MMLVTLTITCNINDHYYRVLLWESSSSKIWEASSKMWSLFQCLDLEPPRSLKWNILEIQDYRIESESLEISHNTGEENEAKRGAMTSLSCRSAPPALVYWLPVHISVHCTVAITSPWKRLFDDEKLRAWRAINGLKFTHWPRGNHQPQILSP